MDIWMPRGSAGPLGETPQRGLKRSRNGQVREQSGFVDIARSMVRDAAPVSKLVETDDLVLGTEESMARMDASVQQWASASLEEREQTITLASAELGRLWNQQCDTKTLPGNVGPESDEGPRKAAYLGTFLLSLHHPSTNKPPVAPQAPQQKSVETCVTNTTEPLRISPSSPSRLD